MNNLNCNYIYLGKKANVLACTILKLTKRYFPEFLSFWCGYALSKVPFVSMFWLYLLWFDKINTKFRISVGVSEVQSFSFSKGISRLGGRLFSSSAVGNLNLFRILENSLQILPMLCLCRIAFIHEIYRGKAYFSLKPLLSKLIEEYYLVVLARNLISLCSSK